MMNRINNQQTIAITVSGLAELAHSEYQVSLVSQRNCFVGKKIVIS